MEDRGSYVAERDSKKFVPIEGVARDAAVVSTIIGGGDVSGAVIMLMGEDGVLPTHTEVKLAHVAAVFLGKQMEE